MPLLRSRICKPAGMQVWQNMLSLTPENTMKLYSTFSKSWVTDPGKTSLSIETPFPTYAK